MSTILPSDGAGALLRFDGVTLWRGGRLLFEKLDLTVRRHERLQLVGPNGSGKSSLLRLAAGVLRQQEGRIDRAPLALADEHLALDRELPLVEALELWRAADGDRDRLTAAMTALGLGALLPVPVRLLSAGQLKRATLVRVAASVAPLWLLDEPTNGLDAQGLSNLVDLIDAHTAEGGAVVAASHVTLGGDWRKVELGA